MKRYILMRGPHVLAVGLGRCGLSETRGAIARRMGWILSASRTIIVEDVQPDDEDMHPKHKPHP